MDWSQERYARLYTRDTPDWVCWPWQARALMPLLLRKVDRTGALSLGRLGVKGLAALVGLPEDVTSTGLDALLEDGSVLIDEQTLLIRNFIEAQETPTSDVARQRDHRERKRAKILKTHDDAVTKRHALSRDVTPGHALSQSVTPNRAVPSLTVPSSALKEASSTCVDPPAPEAEVFDHWAKKLNHPRAVLDDKRRKLIREQLKLGTVDDLKRAIDGVLVDIQSWPERQRFDGIEYVFENRASVEKFLDLALKGNPVVRSKDGYYRAENSNKNRPPPGIVNL